MVKVRICPECKSINVQAMATNVGMLYWYCKNCRYNAPAFPEVELTNKLKKLKLKNG